MAEAVPPVFGPAPRFREFEKPTEIPISEPVSYCEYDRRPIYEHQISFFGGGYRFCNRGCAMHHQMETGEQFELTTVYPLRIESRT